MEEDEGRRFVWDVRRWVNISIVDLALSCVGVGFSDDGLW